MLNRYPFWKNLLILFVLLVGGLYALPNLFGEDPAIQITGERGNTVDTGVLKKVENILKAKDYPLNGINLDNKTLLVRFKSQDDQLKALEELKTGLGEDFLPALNLASRTPNWLKTLGGDSMNLGLDLRGGVHFLMEVDMDEAITKAEERYVSDLRSMLRKKKIRYKTISRKAQGGVNLEFRKESERDKAYDEIKDEYPGIILADSEAGGLFNLSLSMSETEQRDTKSFAIQQNITTLRNRVNELGVAEPVIQQQGDNRIVVQLPGVQDTARAKDILGATATLEFRLVDEKNDPVLAMQTGKVPALSLLRKTREGQPVLMKKQVLLTGESIIDAASGFDQQSNTPAVFITLDGKGARRMSSGTRDNIGKRMAVLFIENKVVSKIIDGKRVKNTKRSEDVINVAVIRDQLSKRFQVTGLDNTEEATNLALLLRAGALAVPMEIVEERTVGPSLGQDNINKGMLSIIVGLIAVLFFMALYYRIFGLVANIALVLNIVLVVALLSLIQATLTLPGIAGIVLTVGMAVDANVLIFERIREEIRNGNSPQASIYSGYEKAFSTIADANITTLIAAVVLFAFGTGPIKGFAVTLSLGIITSMFTAIMGTRAVINMIYGRRKVKKLSI